MTAKKQTRSRSASSTTVTKKRRSTKARKQTVFARIRSRARTFLSRRPHRSFRLTRRREYERSLALPGYWSFTGHVVNTLWQHKKVFIACMAFFAIVGTLLLGAVSQESVTLLREAIDEAGGDIFNSGWGTVEKAGALVASALLGELSPTLSEVQTVYAGFLGLLSWLVVVWLLRNLLAGHAVRMRDGLYSAGAPIVSTFVLVMVLIVQALPIALVLIGYSAATASGLLGGGVEAMLFWAAASLIGVLSAYWMTATFFALIIVTLPGMYPFHALKVAGDMVVGRRLRLLYRLVWLAILTIAIWAVVLFVFVLGDLLIKQLIPAIEWLPIIPFVVLVLTVGTLIWVASYIYLLYRKVVDDDTRPA